MISRLLFLLFCYSILISCDKYDLRINSEYRLALKSYKISDTIYFQSEQNPTEFDTILIKKIDSIRQCPTIGTVPPMKEIYLRIEHLPIDTWKEEVVAGTNEKWKNQPMITLANWNEECCQIRIKFREFKSSIGKSEFNSIENIDTLQRDNPLKITNDKIKEVYWSNKDGIIGYQKFDGHTYKRKNTPKHGV